MTRPSISVDGARPLRKALRDVEDGTNDLKAVHADAAGIVERRAHSLVPRRTGLLDRTIRSSGQASAGVVRAGRASAPYAGPIHFGWRERGIRPQLFLYDALDDRANEVVDRYESAVGDLIDKHGLD